MTRLVNKLLKIGIGGRIGTLSILAFIHGSVHACFEKGTGGSVGACCDEFVHLIYVSIEVAPDKGGFAIGFSGAELELLTDEENALFVG